MAKKRNIKLNFHYFSNFSSHQQKNSIDSFASPIVCRILNFLCSFVIWGRKKKKASRKSHKTSWRFTNISLADQKWWHGNQIFRFIRNPSEYFNLFKTRGFIRKLLTIRFDFFPRFVFSTSFKGQSKCTIIFYSHDPFGKIYFSSFYDFSSFFSFLFLFYFIQQQQQQQEEFLG